MVDLRTVITLLVPSLICWLGYSAYLHFSDSQERPTMLKEMDHDRITSQTHFTRESQFWVYYGSGPSVAVTGWPSQGGIYKLEVCSRVELEFLELDLFNNTLRPSISDPEWQNKENAHCDRSKSLLRLPKVHF